jgi:spectinomycin phosphotransferase
MLDPPDLANEHIITTVRRDYGIRLAALDFLPLGQDVRAWAFRAVAANAATYFLKLRRGAMNQATLRVPRYLADHGVPHIVAPLPTRTHRLCSEVEDYTLTLYPFITGSTGGAHGLQEHHWVTYGAALRTIHDTPLSPDIARIVPRESFTSPWAGLVQKLEAHIHQPLSNPVERELSAFWQSKRAEIEILVERFARLGHRLISKPPPLVLCHADVHHNNVLIDNDDQFWIVDWDDTLLAPKECDMMMGVGGLGGEVVGPHQEAWFLRGYGSAGIDPVALAYYRHYRAVSDIAAYGEEAFLLPDVSEATKRNALRQTMTLFAPGNIVSLANQMERFAR